METRAKARVLASLRQEERILLGIEKPGYCTQRKIEPCSRRFFCECRFTAGAEGKWLMGFEEIR